MTIRYLQPSATIIPGETLQETLDELTLSQRDFALRTGLNPKTVNQIIKGKNVISPETALKFERVLGVPASFWINLENNYQEARLREQSTKRLSEESALADGFTCFTEMVKLKWVRPASDSVEKVKVLLDFFGVDSLSYVMKTQPVIYRRSTSKKISRHGLVAWLRKGEIDARNTETDNYDKKLLISSIEEFKLLTLEPAEQYSKKIREICAKFGVAVVYTPSLKNTHVHGVVRWLNPSKVLMQLSLHRKYADIFWFSFFHELGHVLKHSKKGIYVDFKNGDTHSDYEKEADEFASNTLIPINEYSVFTKEGEFSRNSIRTFSNSLGIHPGIVAGRLAYDSFIKWREASRYRRQLKFQDK